MVCQMARKIVSVTKSTFSETKFYKLNDILAPMACETMESKPAPIPNAKNANAAVNVVAKPAAAIFVASLARPTNAKS